MYNLRFLKIIWRIKTNNKNKGRIYKIHQIVKLFTQIGSNRNYLSLMDP